MTNKRIGIFQYDWPLQSYSKDLAILLTERGYQIDFYLYDPSLRNLVSTEDFKTKHVQLFSFDEKHTFTGVPGKIHWRLLRFFTSKILRAKYYTLSRYILYNSWKKFKNIKYHSLIGIEKQGLNWAGIFGEKTSTPVIYYSLELYIEDHPQLKIFEKQRTPEKYYHKISKATIIQDKFRARALYEANKINNESIYIPVSVRGKRITEKSNYFQKKFNLPESEKIALFFGGMSSNRYCEEIIDSYTNNEQYSIVFHGYELEEGYIIKLQSLAKGKNIYFSTDKVSENDLPLLLRSAVVGFAIYSNSNKNDRYTAYSSQKIALFSRCGIPFIANKNEAFEALIKEYNCARLINAKQEIHPAILEIISNYELFQKEVYKAYDHLYCLDNCIDPLINHLKGYE